MRIVMMLKSLTPHSLEAKHKAHERHGTEVSVGHKAKVA